MTSSKMHLHIACNQISVFFFIFTDTEKALSHSIKAHFMRQ